MSGRHKVGINQVVNNPWFILVCNIISIVGFFLSFTVQNEICKIITCAICAVLVLVVTLYLFFRIAGIKKAKRNLSRNAVATNKKIYKYIHSFYHNLRNYLNVIQQDDAFSSRHFSDKAALLCNHMEKVFTIALDVKEPVSVCIKRIKTSSILNGNIKDWELCTFARSTSTQRERFEYDRNDRDPDKITDNSDFEMIVSNDKQFRNVNCFYTGDLEAYAVEYEKKYGVKFNNSHFQPPYKSTIIVPIRIDSDYMSTTLKAKIGDSRYYHIVGFLCIDSEEKFLKEDEIRYERFKNCVELAFSMGDALYTFLEDYLVKDIIGTISSQELTPEPALV